MCASVCVSNAPETAAIDVLLFHRFFPVFSFILNVLIYLTHLIWRSFCSFEYGYQKEPKKRGESVHVSAIIRREKGEGEQMNRI